MTLEEEKKRIDEIDARLTKAEETIEQFGKVLEAFTETFRELLKAIESVSKSVARHEDEIWKLRIRP